MVAKNDFGKILAKYRKKAGLSQNELAQAIEMSPSHISKTEQGKTNPLRKKNLIKIIQVLGLSETEQQELLSAAGYSLKLYEPIVYSYPHKKKGASVLTNKEDLSELIRNPVVKSFIELLNDESISEDDKRLMENKIISFIGWLKKEIKSD